MMRIYIPEQDNLIEIKAWLNEHIQNQTLPVNDAQWFFIGTSSNRKNQFYRQFHINDEFSDQIVLFKLRFG